MRCYACVAAMEVSVPKGVSGSVSEKSFGLVVKPNDVAAKMSRQEVKKKVMSNVSESVNVRVKAARKTRSGILAMETATQQVLRECKKFGEVGLKVEPPKKIDPKNLMSRIT